MSLHHTILSDLTRSMKEKNTERLSVLRMMHAALLLRAKESGANRELEDDAEVIEVLKKEFKKRRDAAQAFREAGREDLAVKEDAEQVIIESYLPAQLSEDDIRTVVRTIVEKTPQPSFGIVMKEVMQELKGQADGVLVKKIVEESLG